MKEKIKELLDNSINSEKELALGILFLKYKMVVDKNSTNSIDSLSFFCFDECYNNEIEKLEEYYSIKIDIDNPFIYEVIKSLEHDCLVEICDNTSGNKGNPKISIPNGIKYLKDLYNLSNENDIKLSKTVVYNIVNNINIHIGDNINNITQGMSVDDKKEFVEILTEYSKKKDEKSFLKKLGEFSSRVGEGIFIRVVAKLLNPTNLFTILENINI